MSNVAKLKKKAVEFEQKRQYDKALALYVQALEESAAEEEEPEVTLYNRVGDLLLRLGKTGEAVGYYSRAVDLYADGGFLNNAIALCSKILRHDPSQTRIYYTLGRISAQKGFRSDAKHYFLTYAERMQRAGETDESFRALKEFADLCPEQDDIRLMLAEQLSRQGRGPEAVEQLQALHERLTAEGRANEARATAERIQAIDPAAVPRITPYTPAAKRAEGLVFLDLSYDDRRATTDAAEPPAPAAAPARPATAEQPALADAALGDGAESPQPPPVPVSGLETTALDVESSAVAELPSLLDAPGDEPAAGGRPTPREMPALDGLALSEPVDVSAMSAAPESGYGDLRLPDVIDGADASAADEPRDGDAGPDAGGPALELIYPDDDVPTASSARALDGLPMLDGAADDEAAGGTTGDHPDRLPAELPMLELDPPALLDPPSLLDAPALIEPPVVDSPPAGGWTASAAVAEAPAAPAPAPGARAFDELGTVEAPTGFVNLGDWLRESEPPKTTRMVTDAMEPEEGEEFDFDDMLRRFKRGVAENVDDDDHASHYDLGVAFREMGLVDDAIAEFQRALRGDVQRPRAYEALGQCFVDKGQHQIATTVLTRALNEPEMDDQQLVGVLYLLGTATEALGRADDAIGYYQRVFAVDIEFRDVGERLNALERTA